MAAGGEISEPQDALWALRDELPPAIVAELAPPASPLDEPTGDVVTDLEPSEAQLEAALAQARAARPKRDRALLLVELAAHHPEPAQTELQDEALELARTIRVDQGRTLALAAVAVRLPPERREAAIDETLDSLDSGSTDANDVLVRLAPFLSDRQADAAFAAARKIEEPGLRG